MRALTFGLACLLVLGVSWMAGISALRDQGGYSETRKTFLAELFIWKGGAGFHHAAWHTVLSAATFGVGAAWGVALPIAALITLGAWTLVEVAQRYPRVKYANGKPGRFSGFDVLADVLGIAIAWVIVAVIR